MGATPKVDGLDVTVARPGSHTSWFEEREWMSQKAESLIAGEKESESNR